MAGGLAAPGKARTRRLDLPLAPVRVLGVAMLAVGAVRPELSFETVPPCPLRTLTGVPCPFCGSARGVTALVHGHLGRALTLNPGALLAVAVAVAMLVAWRRRAVSIPLWLIAVVLAGMWSYQLVKLATGRPL